jgi:hypothetical protein
MSGRSTLAAFASWISLWISPGGAAALGQNPIDPDLPLTTHAQVFCLGNADPISGEERATCFGARIDENPETLSAVVGTSEATADLRTGTLRPRGVAQALWFGEDQLRAGSLGSATFYDTITVGGGFTGTVEIRLTSAGSFTTTDANPNVMGSEIGSLLMGLDEPGFVVGSTGVLVDQYNDGTVEVGSTDAQGSAAFETNADGLGRFDPSDVRITLSVFFTVDPAHPTFTFFARYSAGAALGFTEPVDVVKEAEGEGTAELAVLLPAGVPWSSASGVLLAPEPGAGAVAAAALASLVATRAGSARTPSARSTRRACAARRARSRGPCPARGR